MMTQNVDEYGNFSVVHVVFCKLLSIIHVF